MAQEAYYEYPPELVFQACINAVACVEWAIRERDDEALTMHIKTPFTLSKLSPTLQDEIDVEVTTEGERTKVWVESSPRFQLWNWGQDERNEKTFLKEVSREVHRVADEPRRVHQSRR